MCKPDSLWICIFLLQMVVIHMQLHRSDFWTAWSGTWRNWVGSRRMATKKRERSLLWGSRTYPESHSNFGTKVVLFTFPHRRTYLRHWLAVYNVGGGYFAFFSRVPTFCIQIPEYLPTNWPTDGLTDQRTCLPACWPSRLPALPRFHLPLTIFVYVLVPFAIACLCLLLYCCCLRALSTYYVCIVCCIMKGDKVERVLHKGSAQSLSRDLKVGEWKLTIMAGVNGEGKCIPPLLISSGKTWSVDERTGSSVNL